jgi:hypothetical protein
MFGSKETGRDRHDRFTQTTAPSSPRNARPSTRTPQTQNRTSRTGVALKQALMWASVERGVAAPWRKWRAKDGALPTSSHPSVFHRCYYNSQVHPRRLTAGHVTAAHREFPPVRHSSDHADLALPAGDGHIHLRDIVFVSNGLKALNLFFHRAHSLSPWRRYCTKRFPETS